MKLTSVACALALGVAASAGAVPVGTAFTYQGRLTDGGTPPTAPSTCGSSSTTRPPEVLRWARS